MTKEQRRAIKEAHDLLAIAARILHDAGLEAYGDETNSVARNMRYDMQMLRQQEMKRIA